MFDGFTLARVDVGEAVLRVRHGGVGTPVLLLHGHPRTHVTWHRVAPLLARRFVVVCPDLRGYGQSSKPPTTANHEPYSKRAMARDGVALMRALGHERFAVAGHDRGCYVAFRMALDHPESVERLVAMDGVPIADALDRCDARFAAAWWHWFFLGQTDKPAERVICADPDAWYAATPEQMGDDAHADWRRAIHDPATVHAMCEDYRAGLGIDREHDEADRAAGRRLRCPTLFLWSTRDDMEELYGDPLAIWRTWGDDVSGRPIDSGHHIGEDAPEELAEALFEFLGADRSSRVPPMIVERSMHPDWLSNTYLVAAGPGGDGFLVDAGGPVGPLLEKAQAEDIAITHVLLTHHHHDHVADLAAVADRYPGAQVLIHPDERELVEGATGDLRPGDELSIGGLSVRAIHTPGHTRGMLSLLVDGKEVFTGDTLFKNSVGGVRAPGHTTYADLKHSIMDVLLELPPETTIRPGHTDPTTVAQERESNAFVRVWRGLEPEGSEPCTAMGEPATLVLLGDDYDGGYKAWVRWPDGSDDIVPGSQVQRG